MTYVGSFQVDTMLSDPISRKAVDVILHNAIQRDITTARRSNLLQIPWNEHYLTRAHPAILGFPLVKRGFAEPMLATQVFH